MAVDQDSRQNKINNVPEDAFPVWDKGRVSNSRNASLPGDRCYDDYNALMYFEDYGKKESEFGWEIDHRDKNPNNNDIGNLRPLFWRNNLARNADHPRFYSFDVLSQKNVIK